MLKNDIFSKMNLKDYNNQLELILEKKDFTEDVKNLLLSMLYKIENAYNDYEKVKINVSTKKRFMKKTLEIISKKCNEIILIKSLSKESKELEKENKKFIVNKEKGIIKVYQNEQAILNAIVELGQEDILVDKEYDLYKEPICDILLLGNRMNQAEIIRDFNGWSWDITTKEIENENINIVYQNILILIGSNFINNWIYNKDLEENEEDEYIPNNEILRSKYNSSFGMTGEEVKNQENINYIEEFKKILNEKYEEKLSKETLEALKKALLAIDLNINNKQKNKLIDLKNKTENKLLEMKDNKKFLEKVSNKKKKIAKEIEEIDKLLNNPLELKLEYEKRNEKLVNKEKIFSISHLAIMLEKERRNKLSEIKKLNKLIEPREFVEVKKELEKENEFYKEIGIKENERSDEDTQIILLQQVFLKCLSYKIRNAQTKREIEELIYELRYYELLPYKEKQIKDIKQIKENLEQIERQLIKKATKQKCLIIFTEDENLNYNILKNIFTTKIIDLDNVVYILKYKKGILTVETYDGNIHENTIEIKLAHNVELSVKLRKKIKVMPK